MLNTLACNLQTCLFDFFNKGMCRFISILKERIPLSIYVICVHRLQKIFHKIADTH